MKKLMMMTFAAATAITAVSMLSAPSFADTAANNEPAFRGPVVHRADKANLAIAPKSAAFKAYHNMSGPKEFDSRYKVRGQGMADRR